jgi:hypothetical protein
MRKKTVFVDDGRVVAPMDFEGTPLSRPKTPDAPAGPSSEQPLTTSQTFHAIGGALLAALLIGFVFVGGLALFLLFAVNVWFR